MLGTPKKILRNLSASATCCILEPGSVMAMKRLPTSFSPTLAFTRSKKLAIANFFFAHLGFHALEKVLLVNVGLERAARLARNDADGALEVHFRFDGFDLRRVGGIENVQLGKALDFSKGHAQNFGAEAGTAHAQQERMFEARLLHVLGDLLQGVNMSELFVGDGEPAEPIAFVRRAPMPEGRLALARDGLNQLARV